MLCMLWCVGMQDHTLAQCAVFLTRLSIVIPLSSGLCRPIAQCVTTSLSQPHAASMDVGGCLMGERQPAKARRISAAPGRYGKVAYGA
jgi:hypothetical protein